jgi:hypothetical protein
MYRCIRFYSSVSKLIADETLSSKIPKKITKMKGEGYTVSCFIVILFKLKISIKKSQFFVDHKKIKISGGDGGDGMVSFMRLYANEWAGPDGGDGGNGGHVIFKGENNLKSLNKVKSLNIGEFGAPGRSSHMRGKNGEHLIIQVPLGTIIKDEIGNTVVDIEKDGQKFIAAHGGRGKDFHLFVDSLMLFFLIQKEEKEITTIYQTPIRSLNSLNWVIRAKLKS